MLNSSEMKKYEISSMHKGQQIFKVFWAKSDKEAAQILDTSVYQIKTYAYKNTNGEQFDGVMAYFDSGFLYSKEPSLLRQLMPLERLTAIIDGYKDRAYQEFIEQISN
jgi:hypothetical protein